MDTTVTEIAPQTYRISTFIPQVGPDGFTFNQFFVNADEPLLFHTGLRHQWPGVSQAIARIRPVEELRWIAFGHVEADECGAMNLALAAAPHSTVVHGETGCNVSLNDLCDRPPTPIKDGAAFDLGAGHDLLHLDTPHVPHNWESRVLFDQTTRTLFCGDLLTQTGNPVPLATHDLTDAALAAESVFGASSLSPAIPATLRRLAELEPTTLAVMHGSSFSGDCAGALRLLASAYEDRYEACS